MLVNPNQTVSDLGITVTSTLSFSSHIEAIVSKAYSRSGLIFRGFATRNSTVLLRAFTTYVRPLLEYCTPVWSPYQAMDVLKIEKVQKRFTKRIPSLKYRTYAERLAFLSLETLELRRLKFDLIMVYKICNDLVDLQFDDFFTLPNVSSTRNGIYSLFKTRARTSIRQHTFNLRVVNVWNALPINVQSASSLHQFKQGLGSFNFSPFLTMF